MPIIKGATLTFTTDGPITDPDKASIETLEQFGEKITFKKIIALTRLKKHISAGHVDSAGTWVMRLHPGTLIIRSNIYRIA